MCLWFIDSYSQLSINSKVCRQQKWEQKFHDQPQTFDEHTQKENLNGDEERFKKTSSCIAAAYVFGKLKITFLALNFDIVSLRSVMFS